MSCKHVLQVKKCRLRAAGGRKQVPTLWVNNCKCFAISLVFPDTTAALIPHIYPFQTVNSAVTQKSALPSFLFTSTRYFCSAGGVLPTARGGICYRLRRVACQLLTLPHSCVNSGRRQLFPSRSGCGSWEAWHLQLFITSPQFSP